MRQQLTDNIAAVEAAIQALTADGGGGAAEPSDVALELAVTGATDPSCVVSNLPFGAYRPSCLKIAVLITDAPPGECADVFIPGFSDVKANQVALEAANLGVLVSSVYVPTFFVDPTTQAIMQNYADVTGGVFIETEADGNGTAEGVLDVISSCGGATTECVTRNSRYWFTHAIGNDDSAETNCANLVRALTANGGGINLGFLRLPVTFENSDNVIDVFDATMEAVGFYKKSSRVTGEAGNTQSLRLKGSKLCNARKQLSAELIAATANVRLLGTRPNNCTYNNGRVVTNFPSNLLRLAQEAAAGTDPVACQQMKALLRKFNNSGVNNNFPGDLVECSPNANKSLKFIARDPTTQLTCPGLNDNCASAEEVYFQSNNPPFSKAKFSRSVNLPNYAGALAYWKVSPPLAVTGRTFRVSTDGSNFDTTLRIFAGACVTVTSNGTTVVDTNGLVEVANSTGSNLLTEISFTTDGVATNIIEVGPAPLAIPGSLKIRIKSP